MPARFPGQKEGENIEFLVRKHWIIYLKLALFLGLTVGLPVLVYFGVEFGFDFGSNLKKWLTLILLLYLELIALITFIRWIEEELDLIIVTNERVISIDQVSFLHRTISETELSQIQDVKHVTKGLLSNIFEFGQLEIQTAAEKIVFRIDDVPDPYKTARKVMDLRDEYKRKFVPKPQQTHNHENRII